MVRDALGEAVSKGNDAETISNALKKCSVEPWYIVVQSNKTSSASGAACKKEQKKFSCVTSRTVYAANEYVVIIDRPQYLYLNL